MPEIAEVELVRRQLEPVLTGAVCTDVWSDRRSRRVGHDELAALPQATLTAVHRHGKYLLISTALPGGRTLLAHLGMTGRFTHTAHGAAAADTRHVRATLTTDRGTLTFHDPRRFGQLTYLSPARYPDTLRHAGPDLLNDPPPVTTFHQSLAGDRRPVRVALLSQRHVAGPGAYLADEACWRAHLHPATPGTQLTAQQAGDLLDALQAVAHAALAAGGNTFSDYRQLDGTAGSYAAQLDVYGRHSLPCRRCGQQLERLQLAGRAATFCPACQPPVGTLPTGS